MGILYNICTHATRYPIYKLCIIIIIANIKYLIFEKQGNNKLMPLQVGFVKQFMEINVNKVSMIPS